MKSCHVEEWIHGWYVEKLGEGVGSGWGVGGVVGGGMDTVRKSHFQVVTAVDVTIEEANRRCTEAVSVVSCEY